MRSRFDSEQRRSGRTTAREAVDDGGFDAVAAAHGRALARVSRDVARAVRALDGGSR